MPKATVTLANGTVVTIDGTPAEIKELLNLYGGGKGGGQPPDAAPAVRRRPAKAPRPAQAGPEGQHGDVDLSELVNLVKNCDEAEAIETQVLDRQSQVDRTLLPLYVVHEHLGNQHALTSGDISKVTTDLGIPISQPNVSRTLSGIASRYVIGDKVRRKGQAVNYKLSRRGVQYLKAVLQGKQVENKS